MASLPTEVVPALARAAAQAGAMGPDLAARFGQLLGDPARVVAIVDEASKPATAESRRASVPPLKELQAQAGQARGRPAGPVQH